MHINYYGLSCFKITAKTEGRGSEDVVIFFSPYGKNTGLRPPQSNADIVLLSHDDEMFNESDSFRGEPLVLDTPGEYAAKGVNIIGMDTSADPRGGEDRGNTVVFSLDVEGMKVVHLGAIGSEPSEKVFDLIIGADILFLPIGDLAGIDGKTAETIARKVEPKVIIPMQYNLKGLKKFKELRDESDFCSNIGNCPKKGEDKLVIKKKDIENRVMEVVKLNVS
ncbi:MAG: MBL fold metallo-hydrolase [Candidatus Moranbacteria bacterium]|nr:MBL fold metallo-hydrolase [Candidatus Moranbacteria bacterium]